MKKGILFSILVLCFTSCTSQNFRNGDIIFHTSKSSQSKMISLVTKSKLTHCGIIFFLKGKPFVFEAVQPVKITPLQDWINRGVGGKYVVSRTKTPLTQEQISRMYSYSKKQLGKNYDIKFQWSDKKMYCSELVFKVFEAGDLTVGEAHKFSDYNLSNPYVKSEIKKRYGNSINLNEMVVTPVDIFNSNELKKVYGNY
jgi:hypothetical protein